MAIARFLESGTDAIDELIHALQNMLVKLEEKRSSLLIKAVTKGLNLDVSMKDSGSDWIGEIPEHWNTRKVKHLFQLMNEPSIASHGMELLSVYTAIGVRPRKSLEQKGNKATSTDGYWLVQKEDLVVNKLLAWMGAIGRSEYDGVTSPAYDILRPLKDTVTEYFHFLFRCGICQPEFKKRSRGIMEMRLRLYFEELGSIEVPCPPPKEQQDIADYIRNLDDTQIDLETKLNKQIEMLTEYRTALISAAVTGKIDVRGL
jgi:type I restriction enzyme S subunit